LKSSSPTNPAEVPKGLVLAVFVTPHGFGHATRVGAVLNSLSKKIRISKIILLGKTPSWFWEATLSATLNYLCLEENTDVGLVQSSPFAHNHTKTKRKLGEFFKQENCRTRHLCKKLQ